MESREKTKQKWAWVFSVKLRVLWPLWFEIWVFVPMQPCNGTCNIVIPERFCRGSSSTSGFPTQAFGNDAFGVGINSFFFVKLCALCVLHGSRFGFLYLCSHATVLVISSSPSAFVGDLVVPLDSRYKHSGMTRSVLVLTRFSQ
jgi:hypothetical protein